MHLPTQFMDIAKLSTIRNSTWILSNFCRGKPQSQFDKAVMELGICTKLVELLLHPSPIVLALTSRRIVGGIVIGDNVQPQVIIINYVLPCLFILLTTNQKKSIKKEACWTISNITIGNRDKIQAVINANPFLSLLPQLANEEFEVKKEAV
eukprot:Gb_23610 [translate_table: standard]